MRKPSTRSKSARISGWATTEVSQSEFKTVMGYNASHFGKDAKVNVRHSYNLGSLPRRGTGMLGCWKRGTYDLGRNHSVPC